MKLRSPGHPKSNIRRNWGQEEQQEFSNWLGGQQEEGREVDPACEHSSTMFSSHLNEHQSEHSAL